MTVVEICYMVMEGLSSNKIVDDFEIDIRLVKQWVILKRSQFLKNKTNSGYDINLNNAQTQAFVVSKIDSVGTPSSYPFVNTTTQKYTIFKSDTVIPKILENMMGPLVLEFGNEDLNKYGYQFVPYERLKFCGNGRFNSGLVYGALKDQYVYLQQRTGDDYLVDNPNCVIRAIFEDPTKVTGYNDETSEFPCSLDVIEYIKNSIFDVELKVMLNTPEDNLNSANDEN